MFGSATARQPETFTCDCCDVEYTGDRTDLHGLGWVRHVENGVFFLMCKACQEYFEPVWARRRAKREAEREARS